MFEKFLQSARPNLQKAFFEPALGKEQQGTGKEELYDKKEDQATFILSTLQGMLSGDGS